MELKFIDRIGIELEGAWTAKPINMIHDGSVKGLPGYKGEVVSPPLKYNDIETFLSANCPTYVNETCGLHVHVSFKDNTISYLSLMEKGFFEYFSNYMRTWGKVNLPNHTEFWNRLEGKNIFCAKVFQPEAQINSITKDYNTGAARRTQLNYCYAMHKTIECRMFPAFNDPKTIKLCVDALLDCYESYLANNHKKFKTEFETEISEAELIDE